MSRASKRILEDCKPEIRMGSLSMKYIFYEAILSINQGTDHE